MAKKPFPFKVCEQCCESSGTGGGGGLTPEELEKLNNAESIANKKTVIDETANDNDYPTTKAVLNYINETFLGGAW